METKILVVDDEENIRTILFHFLSDEGYKVKATGSGTEAVKIVDIYQPDIILMDQNMPGLSGIETLEMVKSKYPSIIVIIITAHGAVSLAVDAIKKGAYDYIEKPFDNDKLVLLIDRAVKHKNLTTKISDLQQKLDNKFSFKNIIGNSNEMQKVLEQVKSVCETDATVLIYGESGVGKELIAQAIHYNSPRKEKPLIAVNCGAIPAQLIESELFGHEKGAFTDAKEKKTGKFEQAHEGTLFLDEIGELPMEAQVKFLRVLEDRKITRIGGKKNIPVDIRIISATNKNLMEKVQENNFRLDLLYRLNIFTVSIPPLRNRKDDIPLLIEHFIRKHNEQLKLQVKTITKEAMKLLVNYNWPGNIRDLENAVQSAMILAKTGEITSNQLPMRINSDFETAELGISDSQTLNDKLSSINEKVEKEVILETLKKHNFNRTETAKELRISRKTLFTKIKKYDLL